MSDPVLERIFASIVGELRSIVREEMAKGPTVNAPVRAPWLTPREAAKAMGVPRKTVYELIKLGRVKWQPCNPRKSKTPTKGTRGKVQMASLEEALSGEAPAPPIDLAKVRARGG